MKKFSCSAELSMKFLMLISIKILKKIRIFQAQINICWHFNIYGQEKFLAQLR